MEKNVGTDCDRNLMRGVIRTSTALALAFLLGSHAVLAGSVSITHEVDFRGDPPGGQILLIDHGRIAYERNFGVRDLRTKQPVDEHTRFEIGSITKQFAAAAILQLQERGKLSLSDRLGQYVPQYVIGKHITIEQLLWQVSGIPDYTNARAYWKCLAQSDGRVFFPKLDLAKVLALIGNRPLRYQPGTKFEYSNTNYYLLGVVVEAVSHLSWEQYVRRNIYARAGMTESSFMSDESNKSNMATGYTLLEGSGMTPVPVAPGGDFCGADGNIVSTARDLAKWDAALFGGKISSLSSLARMTAPGPVTTGSKDYGFGWEIDHYDGVRRLSHSGGTLGFASNTDVYLSISQDVIVLTNEFAYPAQLAFGDNVFSQHNPTLVAQSRMSAAGEDPSVTAIVKALWTGITKGPLDRGMFTKRFSNFMTATDVARFKNEWEGSGPVKTWVYRGVSRHKDSDLYTYYLIFGLGNELEVDMVFNGTHKIEAVVFKPH